VLGYAVRSAWYEDLFVYRDVAAGGCKRAQDAQAFVGSVEGEDFVWSEEKNSGGWLPGVEVVGGFGLVVVTVDGGV